MWRKTLRNAARLKINHQNIRRLTNSSSQQQQQQMNHSLYDWFNFIFCPSVNCFPRSAYRRRPHMPCKLSANNNHRNSVIIDFLQVLPSLTIVRRRRTKKRRKLIFRRRQQQKKILIITWATQILMTFDVPIYPLALSTSFIWSFSILLLLLFPLDQFPLSLSSNAVNQAILNLWNFHNKKSWKCWQLPKREGSQQIKKHLQAILIIVLAFGQQICVLPVPRFSPPFTATAPPPSPPLSPPPFPPPPPPALPATVQPGAPHSVEANAWSQCAQPFRLLAAPPPPPRSSPPPTTSTASTSSPKPQPKSFTIFSAIFNLFFKVFFAVSSFVVLSPLRLGDQS